MRRPERLLAISGAVVAAHLWLLTLGVSGAGGVGAAWGTGHDTSRRLPTWDVRTLVNTRDRDTEVGEGSAWSPPPLTASPSSQTPPIPSADAEPIDPDALADIGQPSAAEQSVHQLPAQGSLEYLPRHMLTAPPRPASTVIIPYPPEVPGVGHHSGRIALYIDEHGTVRRVETLDQGLPPAMVDAARSAFMASTFVPGELNGAPARSRIELEVSFDASD